MTSVNWSFSPVRSGNLAKELDTIFCEDMEYAYRSLKDSGIIIMLIGLTLVAILSGLKLIVHTVNYMKKPVGKVEVLELDRRAFAHPTEEEGINPIITLREATDKNVDHYQPDKRIKSAKAEYINSLRIYLYQHNLQLQGYILKTINHRMSDEDLMKLVISGKDIGNSLTTTHITFGENLNKLIKEALPERVKLRKKKSSNETYLIAENDDFGFLQQHLRNLYQEPVTIKFDDLRND